MTHEHRGELDSKTLYLSTIPGDIQLQVDHAITKRGKPADWDERLNMAGKMLERQRTKEDRNTAESIINTFHDAARGGWVNPDGEGGNPLRTRVLDQVTERQPIQTLMFWGASEKKGLNSAEERLLRITTGILEDITRVYEPGVVLGVIRADVHIAHNGYGKIMHDNKKVQLHPEPQQYLHEVTQRLHHIDADYRACGIPITISVRDLSELYDHHGLSLPNGDVHDSDVEVAERYADLLIANAGRHNRAEVLPEHAAVSYVAMRRRERDLLRPMNSAILLAPGVSIGANDIILPEGMPGIFLKLHAPWFRKE